MSIQVIFLEFHGTLTQHSLNSQAGLLGAKVELFNSQSRKSLTVFIEGKVCRQK